MSILRKAQLDGATISDWPAFHRASRAAFGFPDFYGNNISAWIDCLSGLRDGDGMTRFALGPDEALEIEVLHADVLARKAPEIADALPELVDEVNERYAEAGEKPALKLVLR